MTVNKTPRDKSQTIAIFLQIMDKKPKQLALSFSLSVNWKNIAIVSLLTLAEVFLSVISMTISTVNLLMLDVWGFFGH